MLITETKLRGRAKNGVTNDQKRGLSCNILGTRIRWRNFGEFHSCHSFVAAFCTRYLSGNLLDLERIKCVIAFTLIFLT